MGPGRNAAQIIYTEGMPGPFVPGPYTDRHGASWMKLAPVGSKSIAACNVTSAHQYGEPLG
jgi:hypothetical protein